MIIDCIRYARLEGTKFVIPLMSDELMQLDLPSEIPELTVPVFFFEGRYDQTAPAVLAEEYYSALRAPFKKLVWFEESGHPPDFEEPEKFQREVLAIGAEFCHEAPRAPHAFATGSSTPMPPSGPRASLAGIAN